MKDEPEDVVRHLREMQADRTRTSLMRAYIAALIDEAGWGVEVLAGLMGVSRQTVSNWRKQGRELRSDHVAELRRLPLPPAPSKAGSSGAGQTRSGLKIPDAEEIAAKEQAWVESQLGAAATPAEVPARLKLAAGLVDEAEARLAALKPERADLAWALVCFDPGARRGLQKAGRWRPDEFFAARTQALAPPGELKVMDDRALETLAAQRGIALSTDVDHTRERYFTVACAIIATQARRRAATQLRDEFVRRHVQRDAGGRWKGVTEVAGWINRTQAQVTQICDAGPPSEPNPPSS
ncbi:hypothetical protein GCM10022223_34540 [Kineosporia mesophila]|uniref:Helix-turn-helix domain-containing protein n=1 Tax=Kineosporia mesophila TaxID=566012 RepID=A0ABP6ZRP6_9ACTN|nr:helix-turn-helix domain-containing protein [Kineosporia mesophila]MCD5355088.1 helix-turn-helix domain-containing protein [Kineosporia mesophila]